MRRISDSSRGVCPGRQSCRPSPFWNPLSHPFSGMGRVSLSARVPAQTRLRSWTLGVLAADQEPEHPRLPTRICVGKPVYPATGHCEDAPADTVPGVVQHQRSISPMKLKDVRHAKKWRPDPPLQASPPLHSTVLCHPCSVFRALARRLSESMKWERNREHTSSWQPCGATVGTITTAGGFQNECFLLAHPATIYEACKPYGG